MLAKAPQDGSGLPGNEDTAKRQKMAQLGVPSAVLTRVDAARNANERALEVIVWARGLRRAALVIGGPRD
jgi:hypothetical protein